MTKGSDTAERFGLSSCTGCGACSSACPSSRNGGVSPDSVVSAVLEGERAEGVWKCLLCHRCSAACPEGIDVASLMLEMRNRAAREGDVPQKFRQTYAAVIRDGATAVPKGRFLQAREGFGLSPSEPDAESRKILAAALEGRC